MDKYTIDASYLSSIGSALRDMGATTNSVYPSQMGNTIRSIPSWQGAIDAYANKTLTELTINSNEILAYSYRSQSQLLKVECNNPVRTNIGDAAFNNCTALSQIIIRGINSSIGQLGTNVFLNTSITPSTGQILVPSDLVETYKNNTNWGAYSSIISAIPTENNIIEEEN